VRGPSFEERIRKCPNSKADGEVEQRHKESNIGSKRDKGQGGMGEHGHFQTFNQKG